MSTTNEFALFLQRNKQSVGSGFRVKIFILAERDALSSRMRRKEP
jgi:hypothetical protein